jgi:putative transposase
MGIARSTFYDAPSAPVGGEDLVARVGAICDEFECYGYRRVGAALRHQGVVVDGKKLRRLMRENGLQPKQRRRYVITTDSNHAGPIYPDLAKDVIPEQPSQLWVADLTYVAIPGGFVYLAAILDAWSRKVVGYAISRSMGARIAAAALKAAIRNRAPAKGCIHQHVIRLRETLLPLAERFHRVGGDAIEGIRRQRQMRSVEVERAPPAVVRLALVL